MVAASMFAAGCQTLSPQPFRETASLQVAPESTSLARVASAATAGRAGASGIQPMSTGADALLGRLVLADAAESTLDLQYYLWNDDTTGRLVLERVVAAADRGVRVRLLLDDWGSRVDRKWLRVLDAHPGVEVRMFNPSTIGPPSLFTYLLDLRRLDRRMHNKAFVADGRIAIVGGRNVGDEYFGAATAFNFADFDVMAVGAVVDEIAAQFETYWRCAASWPIDRVVPEPPADGSFATLRGRLAIGAADESASAYVGLVAHGTLADELRSGTLGWLWGPARALYDDPSNLDADPGTALGHLAGQLAPTFRSAQREVIVVSPYVVPGRAGVAFLESLEARGVSVRVLTNSLATTDVVAAHAAYARHREALLDAGVELYETRPESFETGRHHHPEHRSGMPASGIGALHTKVYAIDRETLFVGSFNFDPRSRLLNTELGLLLEIPELAQRVAAGFDDAIANDAWQLRRTAATLTRPPGIEWIAIDGDKETRMPDEPAGGFLRGLRAFLMSLLPIEDKL